MGARLRNAKPYLLLLAVQFGSGGMFIFAMDAINKGMSHYVFIVYRNAIAAVSLAPFAFLLERSPPTPICSFVHSFIINIAHACSCTPQKLIGALALIFLKRIVSD